MRTIASILVACALFVIVGYLAYSGNIILSDFWTGVAVVLVGTALGILYWGFRPQISGFFKEKRETRRYEAEAAPSEEVRKQGSALLPDNSEITRLNIDDRLLDQIYKQAGSAAINIYHDAKLSHFTIQVFPFEKNGPSVNIYFDFYSKWADKTSKFVYNDSSQQVRHFTPDKRPTSDYSRETFTTLPWEKSPQWMQFLDRAYARIKPLSSVEETCYYFSASPTQGIGLRAMFDDGFSGNEYVFAWDGKGLDGNSIKQES
jgi:hypothetical protein